jgi:glutathione synthase/RimK-type ligase-like ATP-grasp enzyme
VDERTRAHLAKLNDTPVLLQERIVGDDVRVTLVGDAVVSAVRIASDAVDYRDDSAYAAGRPRYAPLELPQAAVALAREAARTCAHVIAGVDLKRTPEDAWVVLESNAAPRWLDIEETTGAPITAAVLAALAR